MHICKKSFTNPKDEYVIMLKWKNLHTPVPPQHLLDLIELY